MTRLALTAALVATLAVASTATAATSARWITESQMVASAKRSGVTLNDGTRIRVYAAICNGQGPHRGTYAAPRFKRFRCQLVATRPGGTAWYDARVFPLAQGNWAVVLSRY